VTMRERMVLRTMCRNDRNQTEKTDPVRFHREKDSTGGISSRIATISLERMHVRLSSGC
jgi:hypothetical protein